MEAQFVAKCKGGCCIAGQALIYNLTRRLITNFTIDVKKTDQECGALDIVAYGVLVGGRQRYRSLYKFQSKEITINPGESITVDTTVPLYSEVGWYAKDNENMSNANISVTQNIQQRIDGVEVHSTTSDNFSEVEITADYYF